MHLRHSASSSFAPQLSVAAMPDVIHQVRARTNIGNQRQVIVIDRVVSDHRCGCTHRQQSQQRRRWNPRNVGDAPGSEASEASRNALPGVTLS